MVVKKKKTSEVIASKPYATTKIEPKGVAEVRRAYAVSAATQHLYRAPIAQFLRDMREGDLPETLRARYIEAEGQEPHEKECEAWKNSLPALGAVLSHESLRGSEIFVELWMPLGARRADAVLTGTNHKGKPSAVVVELKQWTFVTKSNWRNEVWFDKKSHSHPSIQALDYVSALRHYHSAFVDDEVHAVGCVWMHNLTDASSIAVLRDPENFGVYFRDCPIFVKLEAANFAQWLHGHLGSVGGKAAADLIAAGVRKPSERLLDMVVSTIKGEHAWQLIDEQRRAYWRVVQAVEMAKPDGPPTVVLVVGGPGTGKSVLAIQLLAHGANKRWRVAHATGSQAFQTNLRGKTLAFAEKLHKSLHNAKYKKDLPVEELFTTFAAVAKAGSKRVGDFDLVVADEAHRLWEFRRSKAPNGTIKNLSTTPMIDEVIRASRVTAFFLDDNQSVRAGEIGHSEVIREAAQRLGASLVDLRLDVQFRCGASESYMQWVDALLGFREDCDLAWRRHGVYEMHLDASMPDMKARLDLLRLQGYKCRIVAGYCWRWSKPLAPGKYRDDVDDPRFEGWKAPWIEKTGQGHDPLQNQYYRWANEESYFDQVGSIYSVQGFEFDHVGVIWGEDLVWRTDRWVADPSKSRDTTFKRDLRNQGEDPVTKLRNVYRVLLTRGMQGTSLFVLDEETRRRVQAMLTTHCGAMTA